MGRIHPRRAHHHSSGHIHQQIVHIEKLFFVNILCVNRRIIVPLLTATAAIPAATLGLHHRRRASGGASYIRRVGGNGDGVPRGVGREVEHGLGAPKRQRRHVVGGRRHLRRRDVSRGRPWAKRPRRPALVLPASETPNSQYPTLSFLLPYPQQLPPPLQLLQLQLKQ
nr:hypothetical protein Iba_chr13dCG9450 [Ipomoea batatas]